MSNKLEVSYKDADPIYSFSGFHLTLRLRKILRVYVVEGSKSISHVNTNKHLLNGLNPGFSISLIVR